MDPKKLKNRRRFFINLAIFFIMRIGSQARDISSYTRKPEVLVIMRIENSQYSENLRFS